MKSLGNHPITGKAEVDENVSGGQQTRVKGKDNKNKKLVVIGVEKKRKGLAASTQESLIEPMLRI